VAPDLPILLEEPQLPAVILGRREGAQGECLVVGVVFDEQDDLCLVAHAVTTTGRFLLRDLTPTKVAILTYG
jgi:hypothetical protein